MVSFLSPVCSCQGVISALKHRASLGSSNGIIHERHPVPLNAVATISGGNGEGDPPVPIPNTEVKPFSADGTTQVGE